MAVYVDRLRRHGPPNGGLWCHMVADTLDELHALAGTIGLSRSWFQAKGGSGIPHYDLRPPRREAAVLAGAVEDTRAFRDCVRKWRDRARGEGR